MTSREIRDLSPKLQVLWNKLNDRVRRDLECQKNGLTLLLTCTYRSTEECNKLEISGKPKISREPSESFEFIVLRFGQVCRSVDVVKGFYPSGAGNILRHALSIGLKPVIDGQEVSWEESHGSATGNG